MDDCATILLAIILILINVVDISKGMAYSSSSYLMKLAAS